MLTPSFVEDKELDTWLQSEARWNNYSETIRKALKRTIQNVDKTSDLLDRSLNFYDLKKQLHKAFFVMLKNNKAKKYKDSLRLGEDRFFLEDGYLMRKEHFGKQSFPVDLISEFTNISNSYYLPDNHKEIDQEFYDYLDLVAKKVLATKKRYTSNKRVITITKEIKSTFDTTHKKDDNINILPVNVDRLELAYELREHYTTKFEFEIIAKTTNANNVLIGRLYADDRDVWCRPIITKNIIGLCEDLEQEINKRITQNQELEQELIRTIPSKYQELIMIEELKK